MRLRREQQGGPRCCAHRYYNATRWRSCPFRGRRLPGGGLLGGVLGGVLVYWRKGRCTGPKSSVLEQISSVSGVLEPDPSTCSRSSTYGILNSSAACPNSRPEAQCVYWYATVRSGVYYLTDCMHLESLNQRDRRRADRRRRRHFLQGSTHGVLGLPWCTRVEHVLYLASITWTLLE